MRVEQPLPLFLALMRGYDARSISLRQLRAQLALVESYHFQVTAILARSSSGGVSKSYASLAWRLSEASSSQEHQAVLRDIGNTLRRRKPERQDFVDAFTTRFRLTDSYARDKRLVTYVLQRIHSHERPHPPIDFSRCTIEHLEPQSALGPSAPLEVIGSIGNLLLLDDTLHGKLRDKSFAAKKRILASQRHSYSMDDILSKSSWTAAEVEERAAWLAGVAYDHVWRL